MHRSLNLALSLLTAIVAGCSGDRSTQPPPVPAHLDIVGGDKQSAFQGQPLSEPIVARVTGADGTPVPNARVDWRVTPGNGALSLASSTADADGRARVIWTVGSSGPQTLTASVVVSFPIALTATATATSNRLLVIHYDGTKWSPSLALSDCCEIVTAIWGASANAVFAGGGCGDSRYVARFDGTNWQAPPGCGFPTQNSLSSISGTSPSDVFGAERAGDAMEGYGEIVHYDGQSWTVVFARGCPSTMCGYFLSGVWARGSGDVFAVGSGGFIAHYDGTSWTNQPSGTTAPLIAVWADPLGSDAFAVGYSGTILHFDGTAWSGQTSGTTQNLAAVWGTSASNIFAAGGNGVLLHYDGTSWSAMSTGTTEDLKGIWGSGSSVFVVGLGGTILRYDGTSLTSETYDSPRMPLAGVWGTSPSNVFAVGGSP